MSVRRSCLRCWFIAGFFAAVTTLLILAGLYFFQYPIDIVYQKFVPLCFTAIAFGQILSFILYLAGGRAPVSTLNPDGNSGSLLVDFLNGRQIAPTWWKGKINVKFIVHRIALIALVRHHFLLPSTVLILIKFKV